MKALYVWTISVGVLTAAAGLKWAATAQQQGPVFIAGDRPVNEEQVRTELRAEGWSNVQIERNGTLFRINGTRNGQPGRLAVDAETGRLHGNADDDDDD
jgi:hypothetical protein